MPLYRVDFLDRDGTVLATNQIEADNDDMAIAAACAMNVLPDLGSFEVWDGKRLVYPPPIQH